MTTSQFHLGIIGGCMSHQIGIPYSQLYHRQIAARLLETTNTHLRVHIARNFERDYAARLDDLMRHAPIDGVLLHMRVMYVRKAGLVYGFPKDGVTRYYLHPFIFSRSKYGWAQYESAEFKNCVQVFQRTSLRFSGDLFERPRDGRYVFGFRLKDINFILGTLLRLDEWAINDELQMLERFHKTCHDRQIPFLVLGPTPAPDTYRLNRLCRKMNQRLAPTLTRLGIPFCAFEQSVDADGQRLVKGDGIHLTLRGQAHVANLLLPHIESLIHTAARNQIDK